MLKREKHTKESGTGRDSFASAQKVCIRRGIYVLSVVMTVLLTAAGAGLLQAHADTPKERVETVVVTASSDLDFARKSSELAKKSRGLTLQSTGKAMPYSSGRLIVRVKNGEKVDFSKYNADTVIESEFGVSLVQFSSASEAKKAAKKISELSEVSYVEPDDCSLNLGDAEVESVSREKGSEDLTKEKVSAGGSSRESAEEFSEKTPSGSGSETDDDGQVAGQALNTQSTSSSDSYMSWGTTYIQADKYSLYVRQNTKRAIKVAVVDSGVYPHEVLSGRLLAGKDFVDNDSNPCDKNGHGTHVAGIIADCTQGTNVKILPVRVMNEDGEGSPSVVGNGIRYAVNSGAKVINLSLGAYEHYRFIEECVTYAHNKGVTVVVASGNETTDTKYVCPAHMSSPIVVGAINSKGQRASYSNYGSSLDIVAPGLGIRSCWLYEYYATVSGTSMAAPHISAVAALYRIMNPSITPARTEYLVRCYAKDLGAKGTDRYYGRGVPRMAGAIAPSSLMMQLAEAYLKVNTSVTLKTVITPTYAGLKKLTWTSSNENVVTVNGGKLTGKKIGTAVVTAKTVNGKTASCKVIVTSVNADPVYMSGGGAGEEYALKKAPSSKSSDSVKQSSAEAARVSSLQSDDTSSEAVKESSSDEVLSTDPSDSGESVTTEQTAAAAGAQTGENIKIYIYPSEKAGNAQVQDGSIVAGARLALEAEIVPAQNNAAALQWESSDPEIASVDKDGVVTAVSEGKAQIKAFLASADDSGVSTAATAEYAVTVIAPSVMTRNISYNAGEDKEVNVETILRLPVSLDEENTDEEEKINPSADYVMALLSKTDEEYTLLGAVNLGGEDGETIHVHDPETDEKRTDIKSVGDGTLEILADPAAGKQASETGILSMRSISAEGCKADTFLGVRLETLRAAARKGPAHTETLEDCRIAVYTEEVFEEREKAVEEQDKDKIKEIDDAAICTCSFAISYDVPEQEEETSEQVEESEEPVQTVQPGQSGQNGKSSGEKESSGDGQTDEEETSSGSSEEKKDTSASVEDTADETASVSDDASAQQIPEEETAAADTADTAGREDEENTIGQENPAEGTEASDGSAAAAPAEGENSASSGQDEAQAPADTKPTSVTSETGNTSDPESSESVMTEAQSAGQIEEETTQ